MKSVNPYLNFNGNTEEVFKFYQKVFGGDLQVSRFGELEDNMGATGDDLNKIANISLSIGGGTVLYGSDTLESMNQKVTIGNNFYIQLETESIEETDRLFKELSAGGEIEMSLQDTGWAEKFGMFADKFGIQWMVYFTGE